LDFELTFLLCLGAAIINLPFGYYRAGTRRLSWQWFLAIHLPVPLIFIGRIVSGVSWEAIPFIIAFDLAGQLMGGMLRTGFHSQRAVGEVASKEED
jgi:hypothetical protein